MLLKQELLYSLAKNIGKNQLEYNFMQVRAFILKPGLKIGRVLAKIKTSVDAPLSQKNNFLAEFGYLSQCISLGKTYKKLARDVHILRKPTSSF